VSINNHQIKEEKMANVDKVCIFDFDGTLFANPTPRQHLWPNHFGKLKFEWYQHQETLSCVTNGMLKEDDWWNTMICQEIAHQFCQDNIIILMTGRKSDTFYGEVYRILCQRGFEEIFSEIILKPVGSSTLDYKFNNISRLYDQYNPNQIVMYDDRQKHVAHFQKFMEERQIPGEVKFVEWDYHSNDNCQIPHKTEKEIGNKILKRIGIN
jgi:hypothetical protein